MRRREFIAGFGAAAWPLAARAQQGERMRRVGVLMPYSAEDGVAQTRYAALLQRLGELGWTVGRNLRVDARWAAASVDLTRVFAKELVDLQPDAIFGNTSLVTAGLQRETRTIPIVFVGVSEPVSGGLIASLPRPGGNATGFTTTEPAMMSKWLQLLTEVAPAVKRVAIIFNPDTAPSGGSYILPPFEAAARSIKVEPIAAPVHSDAEIETVINSLGHEPGGGLVHMPDGFVTNHRGDGGLLSYGPDNGEIIRGTATYLDRILRGAKPSDLPVQLPVKFEMAVNLKTAKALGLTIPETLLATADEIIQ
jgi:putative ABC transport system substrate-binding protein